MFIYLYIHIAYTDTYKNIDIMYTYYQKEYRVSMRAMEKTVRGPIYAYIHIAYTHTYTHIDIMYAQ